MWGIWVFIRGDYHHGVTLRVKKDARDDREHRAIERGQRFVREDDDDDDGGDGGCDGATRRVVNL